MKHTPALLRAVSLALAFSAGWVLSGRRPDAGRHPALPMAATGQKEQSASIPAPPGPEAATAPMTPLPPDEAALRVYVRGVLTEGKSFARMSRTAAVLAGMNRENARIIQSEIESVIRSGRRLNTEKLMLEYRLGEVLGRDAVDSLRPADPEAGLPSELTNIITGWGGEDPGAAMEWFNKLPDGKFRDESLPWVINGLCAHDLNHAQRIYAGLPGDMQLRAASQMLWNSVQARGPEGTEPWVSGLQETARQESATPEQRRLAERMLHDLTKRWLHDSPEAAAAFLSRQGAAAAGAREAMDTVMEQWTVRDAPAAQKWAETFAGTPGGAPGQ